MYSLMTLLATAAACLVAGGVIGALVMYAMAPGEQRNRDMERRLAQAEDKLQDYQSEVSEHFAKTSELINNLTQSYREVHQYLANSAMRLSNPDVSRRILDAATGELDTSAATEDPDTQLEPPKDYAPKRQGRASTLSEEYGLQEEEEPVVTPRV